MVLVECLGREGVELKSRPAVVVQSDAIRTELHKLVICPITSRASRGTGQAYRIAVERRRREGQRMNLRQDSVIMCDDLYALHQSQIRKRIGTCGLMDKVDAAIRSVCGLEMPDARSPGPSDIT